MRNMRVWSARCVDQLMVSSSRQMPLFGPFVMNPKIDERSDGRGRLCGYLQMDPNYEPVR